jgi:CheY-like chemotaxis protein/AraC-like DNA-binding protein
LPGKSPLQFGDKKQKMDDFPLENWIISQDFVQQVRDLLENLYDFPLLQKKVLVLTSPEAGHPPLEITGQKARKLVLDALEKIGEEKGLPFRSSQARIYNLLRLHYIEGMEVQQLAQELGLSPRQVYRDLRAGDERIASIVWENLSGLPPAGEKMASTVKVLEDDRLQMEAQFQPTDLNELVSVVCKTVRPLSALLSVSIDLQLPEHSVIVPTDEMIARQVITGLLSLAIQQASTGSVEVNLLPRGDDRLLQIVFHVTAIPEKRPDPTINLYAQNLGWSIHQKVNADQIEIVIKIKARQEVCLVIDDHQGFVELLERYLADYSLHIVASNNGPKGIELAEQLQPKVILLDVMIPEMDGWQILQRLHSTPVTRAIPVIICSVFYDPDLAFTLGAVYVLKKPVRKEGLIAALKKINIL